jgi:MarR family transcriptional regulator, organic hydroperoxide resistance regulator
MSRKNEKQIDAEQVSMQILMRLRQILQEMSKHSKMILENYKISTPQLICLHEVFQHGPISIGALTKIVFLNNSTVTGVIDRLEKRELVRRVRISKDRRQVHVEVTDQGIEFINRAPKPIQEQFMDRLIGLDQDTISLILWSLEMLVDMLGNKGSTLEIPMSPSHISQTNGIANVECGI